MLVLFGDQSVDSAACLSATEKDFLAYQEFLAGHKPPDCQREAIATWVPVIISTYTNWLLAENLAKIAGFIAQSSSSSPVFTFLEKVKFRMLRVAEQRRQKQ